MNSNASVIGAFVVVMIAWAVAAWPRDDVLDLAPKRRWSMGRLALIASGVTAVCAGSYFGNQYLSCQRLEEDFLNSFATIKSTSATIPLVDEGEAKDALAAILEKHKTKSTETLIAIGSECGQRAADTAHRKATELIFR